MNKGAEAFRRLRASLLPPVSKKDAMRIASAKLAEEVRGLSMTCHRAKPANCTPYLARVPTGPYWYVYARWDDGKEGLHYAAAG